MLVADQETIYFLDGQQEISPQDKMATLLKNSVKSSAMLGLDGTQLKVELIRLGDGRTALQLSSNKGVVAIMVENQYGEFDFLNKPEMRRSMWNTFLDSDIVPFVVGIGIGVGVKIFIDDNWDDF